MKIAVIGGGGREHAVIKKLAVGNPDAQIFAIPGNGGIAADAQCVPIKATDIDAIVEFSCENAIDLVVVTPDDPLALGLVDRLSAKGILAFGPTAAAARIESSKVFSKQLMEKYNIPTAKYKTFDKADDAARYLAEYSPYPVVIKADGLALGKGVIIAQDEAEAVAGVKSIMQDKIFGASGNRIIIEEFLTGPEVSILTFTDGKAIAPMASSMDHKRAFDGDKGLNTGGMGAIAPNPFYTAEIAQTCMETIFMPTVQAMNKEGCTFRGCLYFGIMLTPNGPRVIEYNCRFGDPETQAVLPLLEGNLFEIFMAVINSSLTADMVKISKKSACCLVLASGGYPQKYDTGKEIAGIELAEKCENVTVYHAGTKLDDGKLLTAGGRVLGVTAVAESLDTAVLNAYTAAENIKFDNMQFRRDIGASALKQRGKNNGSL